MAAPYSNPGDPIERHNADTLAHLSSEAPPVQIIPMMTVLPTAATAWYLANAFIANRFQVQQTGTWRFINIWPGTASGNIQVGIATHAQASNTTANLTPLVSTGIIACPTGGALTRLDLGNFTLTPGDYALWLWCDNTTATFNHNLVAGYIGFRASITGTPGASGLTTVFTGSYGTRYLGAMSIEST